jgi:cell division protein FtsQ
MRAAAALPRALARIVAWPTRATWSLLPSRWRRGLIVLGCAAALLAGGYVLWFRDSALVRVDEVTVEGLTSGDSSEIRAALVEAARGMTTLHLDTAALERAVARYPAVADLAVDPGFPDSLAIEVSERRPVATVTDAAGKPLPVAAGGTLLPDFEADDGLPPLPTAVDSDAERLTDQAALGALAVADAAPPELAARIEQIAQDELGELQATLQGGLLVLLGEESRLEEKWAAAAAVIAAGDAAGAGYLDVSVPERPAVGG